jgi:hypothetical protein
MVFLDRIDRIGKLDGDAAFLGRTRVSALPFLGLEEGEGVLAGFQGEGNGLSSVAVGFEDGADHFDGGATGFGVAQGGAIFLDGSDEVETGGGVGGDVSAEVGEGFFGGESVAVDGEPGLGGGAGVEGAAAAEVGKGFGVNAEVDEALGADELKAEAGVSGAGVLDGVEEEREAVFHFEAGVRLVTGEGADAFGAVDDAGLGDGQAVLEESAGAGQRPAHENGGEVKEVAAEDPEVEGAAAGVLLATGAGFEEAADGAVGDEFLAGLERGVVAIAVGDGEAGAAFFAGGDDFISLLGAAAEGFFDVDAAGAGAGGGEDHGVMLVDVAGTDGDEVGFDLLEHGGIGGKSLVGGKAELLAGGVEAGSVGISDSDEAGAGEMLPHGVETVAVVAATGVADDGDAIGGWGRAGESWEAGGGRGEELAAGHEERKVRRGERRGVMGCCAAGKGDGRMRG